MPEFLRLDPEEQTDILSAVSAKLGRSAQVLQKDVWVCWALKQLFAEVAGVRMAFKGGTSLSKVFGLIHRFSEDVDVTLDYRDLVPGVDPLAMDTSKSQVKRLGQRLRDRVQAFVHDRILPALSSSFRELTADNGRIESSEDGERVWLYYPSLLGRTSGYIQDSVLLEFGGRNATEPSGKHTIRPILADEVPGLGFPVTEAVVLDPQRTFWEKATLIHVECNRQRQSLPDRLSRHWYDLVMVGQSTIGVDAMSNRTLLEDVVAHKQVFFDASYARYDDCLTGAFRLVPDDGLLSILERDYREMMDAGMFDVEPPAFADIVDMLRELEKRFNRA